jgi:hypothetical protein
MAEESFYDEEFESFEEELKEELLAKTTINN